MTYTSPFRLLNLGAEANLDKSTLNLAKKKTLAEIELSSSQTIVLGGQEMTKNDVLQLFDGLGKMQHLEYHQAIAKDRVLLYFLEQGKVADNTNFAQQEIYNNFDFIEFISPYFSKRYGEALIEALREGNNKAMANYLSLTPVFLNDSDTYHTWEGIETYIGGETKAIEDATEQIELYGAKKREELAHFYDYKFLACLNRLPAHFESVRDTYARALYNLATVQWNKREHQNALEIVKEATLLNTYPETQTMMRERITWFNTQLNKASSSSSSSSDSDNGGTSPGKILFYVVLFILNFARMGANCNKQSSSPSYDYDSKRVSVYPYPEEAPSPISEALQESRAERKWLEIYLAKEKAQLDKLYLSKKQDKKTIRALAKNQLALYKKAKSNETTSRRKRVAKKVHQNVTWLYSYGQSSDGYISELIDWFEAEIREEKEGMENLPKEKGGF